MEANKYCDKRDFLGNVECDSQCEHCKEVSPETIYFARKSTSGSSAGNDCYIRHLEQNKLETQDLIFLVLVVATAIIALGIYLVS